MLNDFDRVVVDLREKIGVQDLLSGAVRRHSSLIEQDHLVEGGSHVEVVENGYDRSPATAERAYCTEDHLLMSDVEGSSGFIEK